MFNKTSFATLLANIITSFGEITPETILGLNTALENVFAQFGQTPSFTSNLYVKEETNGKFESYESRSTFRGNFSSSNGGKTSVGGGWIDTSWLYVSQDKGCHSIGSSSYSKHDLFGERSESHSKTTYIPIETGETFFTIFKLSSKGSLEIKFSYGSWRVTIPMGVIESVQCYIGEDFQVLPTFESYPEALAWAMENNYLNTAWFTKKYLVVLCAKEELEKTLFYVAQRKWDSVDGWRFLEKAPNQQVEVSMLVETHYPNRVEANWADVWYVDGSKISTTGWGNCASSAFSSEMKEIKLPYNYFPDKVEVEFVRRDTFIHKAFTVTEKNQGNFTSLVDGKFQWNSVLQEWKYAIIFKEKYGEPKVLLISDKDWIVNHALETIFSGKKLEKWHSELTPVLMSLFDLPEYGGLKVAVKSHYRDKMARLFESPITGETEIRDLCLDEASQKEALGL